MQSHHVSILFNDAQDVPDDGPDSRAVMPGRPGSRSHIAALTEGRDEYELTTYLHRPVRSVETVRYRHHVLRDLEREPVREAVGAFASGMARVRTLLHLVDTLRHARQQQRWFVSAAAAYCGVVSAFTKALQDAEITSPGFRSLCDYLENYTTSAEFEALSSDTHDRETELSTITYTVHLRGTRVTVSACEDEPDVSQEVGAAFAKFQQGSCARPPRSLP